MVSMKILLEELALKSSHSFSEHVAFGNVLLPSNGWSQEHTERSLEVTLPEDIITGWSLFSDLYLCTNAQSNDGYGMHIASPDWVVEANRVYKTMDGFGLQRGDVIIGEFLDNGEFLGLRCDVNASDFGSVMVKPEIAERYEWPVVADSLSEFITAYLSHDGRRFWDNLATT